jgi:hypothetical protein
VGQFVVLGDALDAVHLVRSGSGQIPAGPCVQDGPEGADPESAEVPTTIRVRFRLIDRPSRANSFSWMIRSRLMTTYSIHSASLCAGINAVTFTPWLPIWAAGPKMAITVNSKVSTASAAPRANMASPKLAPF